MRKRARPLTPRQREVIEWVASGVPAGEVARRLGVTPARARRQVRTALLRLLDEVGTPGAGPARRAGDPGAWRGAAPDARALLERPAAEHVLRAAVEHARRTGRPLSVLLLVSGRDETAADPPGAPAAPHLDTGRTGGAIAGALRRGDRVVLWGNRAYLVILPDCDREGAASVLARMSAVNAGWPVTAGLAELHRKDSPASLVRRAERAAFGAGLEKRVQHSLWLAAGQRQRFRPVLRDPP